ncbi:MAG: hypothetical protein AAFQ43_02695, partial [Bacteroidota bacterium]
MSEPLAGPEAGLPPLPPPALDRPHRLRPGRPGVGALLVGAPLALVALGVLVPLAYLVARALDADVATAVDLVFRARNAGLLLNTVALAGGVLALTTLIAGGTGEVVNPD